MSAKLSKAALGGWLLVAVYYFYQYALRSAPSVMMSQLETAFGKEAVSSIVGMFYFGYSPFSLVAGAAIDRYGARWIVPIGAAMVGVGALLFGTGIEAAAIAGRFLQGAGGVFALVGAVYLVNKNVPASMAALFIGATQMFGMAGGSAGQFGVGLIIDGGLPWGQFWIYAGVAGLALSICLFLYLPKEKLAPSAGGVVGVLRSLGTVFVNPQSSICGFVSGLLFIPTTIFGMTWGVRFLQEARDRDPKSAVMLAATIPLGWMIGCPLLGFISDKLGRRKPVILGGAVVMLGMLAWILYGDPAIFRGLPVGILLGIASGAAMLPYTVIKEANPPDLGGSATGVINFINFTFSALLGPVFGARLQAGGDDTVGLAHHQAAFAPLLAGIAFAMVLTCFLRETGPAARTAAVKA
jgi:MFS family permease